MRVLITGAGGQLGKELQKTAPPSHDVSAFEHGQLDIASADAVREVVDRVRPQVIINAAAYTAVDKAEDETDLAFKVNSDGARNVAEAAVARGAGLVHLSTDFVFSGKQSEPYLPADTPDPISVYGASKAAGEEAVLATMAESGVVLRTAWLYSSEGGNFVNSVLGKLRHQDELEVVVDQVGSPTWARALSRAIWQIVEQHEISGIHHWTDAGIASRYDFAVAIQEEAARLGLVPEGGFIRPTRSGDIQGMARRPAYAVLDKSDTWEALAIKPCHWRDSLRTMLKDLQNPQNA